MRSQLINEAQRLKGAKGRFGHPIPTYDDGFGQLFIYRDSMGISGIVRAKSWEDAYSICEDEFFPEADETLEEMEKEYSTVYKDGKDVPFDSSGGGFTDHPCWQEAYGWRPNGRRSKQDGKERDPIGHGIYAKELNGDSLDVLTPELVAYLGITLELEEEEES